jgi:hypothetical protein
MIGPMQGGRRSKETKREKLALERERVQAAKI